MNSRMIAATSQSVANTIAKSCFGIPRQYSTANTATAGAVTAAIMENVSSFGVTASIIIEARSHRQPNIADTSSRRTAASPVRQFSTSKRRFQQAARPSLALTAMNVGGVAQSASGFEQTMIGHGGFPPMTH